MATRTRCARCGRENEPGVASCLDCGAALATAAGAACASCGAALQPGFRFCGTCGRPAAATGDAHEAGPKGTSPHLARPVRAAARAARFRLVRRGGGGAPDASFPIRGAATCGRAEGEVRLADDPTVSPRHVRLREDGGALRAEDLGSANGTFLRLRAPRALRPGDEVRLGHQLLRLEPVPRPAGPGGVRAWGGRDLGCRFRLAQLLEGGGVGEVFPLRDGENAIGRDAGEASFPADRWVSARHARVDVEGDAVTLADLGSANGTFVRIAGPVALGAGDELLVGGRLLRVEER